MGVFNAIVDGVKWLPSPMKEIAVGVVFVFFIVGLLKLVRLVMNLIPFV